MQAQTVVIVGAGISGLQVARALLKRGQHPLVIEQGEAVGGVWTNKAYQGLGVQGKWLA
jgi:cation diffusion facilitator CzcD-associated flavoprotein CzcO